MTGYIIKNIEIRNLWDKYNLTWHSLNKDVNVLVGINGSGKSTLLRILSAALLFKPEELKKYGDRLKVRIEFVNETSIDCDLETRSSSIPVLLVDRIPSALLSTFDSPLRDKERLQANETSLDQELDFLIYQREKDTVNFTNYRLKATMPKYKELNIADNIEYFFQNIINPLFARTGKTIDIDETTSEVVFRQDTKVIRLSELSSGEKQILIIMFRLFLMEKKEHIVLMDEPEISLHIEWQQHLIDTMLKVNPNCQFIMSTHSPSIFGKGWMNKMILMDDLKS